MVSMFNIFEPEPFPRYFAVLRPTSGGGPSYQFCKSEFTSVAVEERHMWICIVENADIPLQELERINRHTYEDTSSSSRICETKARNLTQTNADVRTIAYWKTPHYFRWNEYEIPVLDFNKRFFLTRQFERITPANLSYNTLFDTIDQYNILKERQMRQINPPSHSTEHQSESHLQPTRTLSSQIMPVFVVDLILRDQCEKNNSCPITLTPYSSLTNLGISPCYHLFDYQAIERWIQIHHICPVCRAQLRTVQHHEVLQN